MERIEICPNCQEESPPLGLMREDILERTYDPYQIPVPESINLVVICHNCGTTLQTLVIENTLQAIKDMRDEMDKCYGPSKRLSALSSLRCWQSC